MDMETAQTAPIEVTQKAAVKARSLAEREGQPDACLRVRVTAGGCAGFHYKLTFEETPTDDDNVIQAHGLRVLVDPKSVPVIEGSTLDFNESLLGGGFKMLNPRAVQECACGESFSV